MKKISILFFCFVAFQLNAQVAGLRTEDNVRLKEAVNIAMKCGEELWEGWSAIPISTILITQENEYLIFHPYKPEDFKTLSFDKDLNSEIYYRQRKFNTNLLATFSAVDSIPSIVVGTPENTGKSSSEWVITMLHEHFHQMQYSMPGYAEGINKLDLSGGDSTGMWMLNYNFPYEDEKVGEQFRCMLQSALLTVISESDEYFTLNYNDYMKEKDKFNNVLNEKDYRYFSFQLWQEGIARYTEYKILEIIKNKYKASDKMRSLADFTDYKLLHKEMIDKLKRDAMHFRLKGVKRTGFYVLGALEGLILDRVNPNWRNNYFKEMFYTDKYF